MDAAILNYMNQQMAPMGGGVDQRRMTRAKDYLDTRRSIAGTRQLDANAERMELDNSQTVNLRAELDKWRGQLHTPAGQAAIGRIDAGKMMALQKHYSEQDKIGREAVQRAMEQNLTQLISSGAPEEQIMNGFAMLGELDKVTEYKQQGVDNKQTKIENKLAQDKLALERRKTALGQSGGNTERMRKIQGLVDRGLSPNEASDLVEGRVSMTTPNSLGEVFLVNKTDGTKKKVVGASVAQPEIGMEQSPVEQSPGTSIVDAAREGTGPISAAQQGVSNLLGFMAEGQLFKENTEARQKLNLFNNEVKRGLIKSDRFPVWEQKLVSNLVPSTDQFLKDLMMQFLTLLL